METRIRFNQPYSCIEVIPGWSTEVLPGIDWEKHKSILWLDYTGSFEGYMFQDIATFFSRAISGSVFIISINVEIKDESEKTVSKRIKKKLEKDPTVKNRVSSSYLKNDLNRDGYYRIIREIIDKEITEILSNRNKTEEKAKYKYEQIFNFLYKDGATMLTLGGVLYAEEDESKVTKMAFDGLEFVKHGVEYFEIKVPHLTNREIHVLNKHLPKYNTDENAREKAKKELKGVISDDAIEKYAKIYRYFPIYTEANL